MNPPVKYNFFILFVICLEGFVSISVEILAIRQLLPVVGSSVIVTSLIIGIFLLFLALGYWRGGFYEGDQERFVSLLRRNFTIAGILIGVGLSYPVITIFFTGVEHYLGGVFLLGLAIYLLFVIAPITYFLGQTVPLTMNLIGPGKRTAEVGGNILFISTLGSFLGALLSSLLLMEYLGVAWTILINFLLLLFMTMLFFRKRKGVCVYVILAVGVGWFVYNLNVGFERIYFVATTNYANYRISEGREHDTNQKGKTLEINHSFSSFLSEKKQAFSYVELIKRILFDELKLNRAEILVLGAGGFTLSAEKTQGNYFTYVDIDPKIKSVVEKHFLPGIKGKFVAEDARRYLPKYRDQYDAIVSDVYSNLYSIPTHLLTKEYFSDIRGALKSEGVAIFNIIAHPFLKDRYSKRVDSTIRYVFGNCLSIPLHYSNRPTNIIYVCAKENNAFDQELYTDNRNTATYDFAFLR